MKKLILLYILVQLFWTGNVLSQCLPDGITFTTQEQIDSFQTDYPNCTEIEGDVLIEGQNITNLNGLSSITKIYNGLYISNCESLTSFSGLDNLNIIVGELRILNNEKILNIDGLNNITSIEGAIWIWDNNNLTDFSGLENLTSIADFLTIGRNNSLTSLSAFNNITTIGDNFLVFQNNSLTNFVGLEGLTSIGGDLEIDNNSLLKSLTGLENIENIGGLTIQANDSLTSLEPLSNIKSIGGGYLSINDNASLENLVGIDSIDAESIYALRILDNPLLSSCEVQSICTYLAASDNDVIIENNDIGCNNQSEIEESCEGLGISNYDSNTEFFISPNPAKNKIQFISKSNISIELVKIYNQFGQVILTIANPEKSIDVSNVNPGYYIVEFITEKNSFKEKVLINR